MLISNSTNLAKAHNQANPEIVARSTEHIQSLELAREVLVTLDIVANNISEVLRGTAACLVNDDLLDSHFQAMFEVTVSQLLIAAPSAFFVGGKEDIPIDIQKFDPDIPDQGEYFMQSFVQLRQFLDDANLGCEFRFQVQEMFSKVFAAADRLNEIWNSLCEQSHLRWDSVQKLSTATSFRASEQDCAAICYQVKFLDRSCQMELKRLKGESPGSDMAEATLPNFSGEPG